MTLFKTKLFAAMTASLLFSASSAAAPIFTLDMNPSKLSSGAADPMGLTYATELLSHSGPVTGMYATDILGTPDFLGGSPYTGGVVDFNGHVTIGFGQVFHDVDGVDAKVFVTQLDPTEGFDLYASENGVDFTLLGTWDGPTTQLNTLSIQVINIDFNGSLPVNARYLRFVNETPLSTTTYGTDFDAVGVTTSATAVPLPASLGLLALGLMGMGYRFKNRSTRSTISS